MTLPSAPLYLETIDIQAETRVKICAKCRANKVLDDFHKSSKNSDGRQTFCKKCSASNGKSWLKQRSLKPAVFHPFTTLKTCRSCHQPKTLLDFEKHIGGRYDRRAQCLTCRAKVSSKWRQANADVIKLRNKTDPVRKKYMKKYHKDNGEKLNKYTREWRKMNPEQTRKLHIIRRFRQYGITQEWYDRKLAEQGGGCAICGSPDPKNQWNTFHVDHNHSCCSKSCHACDNCRRGLLCSACNTRLGHLENIPWKNKAMAYLETHAKR